MMNVTGIWELKKIAMRNLARHKVKTALTTCAVTIAVAMFIWISCWIGGMIGESRRNIVNFDLGAAKLQTRLHFEKHKDMPSYENFTGWERYRDALANAGYASAPRFTFGGVLFAASGSNTPIVVNAVDFETERRILYYADFVDFGRLPESGAFEIALGTIPAERLRVGIPTRPLRLELEEVIASVAQNDDDAAFIRSLYNEVQTGFMELSERTSAGNERLALRRGATRAELDRYWELVAATDRNNVRVNAMIDVKTLPEIIRQNRWEGELLAGLNDANNNISASEIELVTNAYVFNDTLNVWELIEEDADAREKILAAMIRADFSGAIQRVNQLIDAKVVGIINSPDPVPNQQAYMPLDALQDESGMMLEGAVTELVIRKAGSSPASPLPDVNGDESAAAILSALERALGEPLRDDLGVFFYLQYIEDYLGFEELENTMPRFMMMLLIALSFLVISNTILLAILERTKEIGMMRAMGMTDGQMIITYMFEAGFLGMVGSLFGTALGCLLTWPMVEYGWDMSQMVGALGGDMGFRITALFRSMWEWDTIAFTWIVTTVLASFMAYLPTRRALKKPITDCLRFD